jgi:hypothetical protein
MAAGTNVTARRPAKLVLRPEDVDRRQRDNYQKTYRGYSERQPVLVFCRQDRDSCREYEHVAPIALFTATTSIIMLTHVCTKSSDRIEFVCQQAECRASAEE